ncbi:MAG: cardiolipin synthase [Deltaproteobacteria bacterium]|nr:cardiolipin synthase [Deltaproteobacteria bacterium]
MLAGLGAGGVALLLALQTAAGFSTLTWWWGLIVLVLELALVVLAGLHILLNKRNTASALLWLVVVVVVPIVGTLIYVAFGVDRHGRRATAKELRSEAAREQLLAMGGALTPSTLLGGDDPDETCSDPLEADRFPDALDPFAILLARVGRYRAAAGCSLELLPSGDAFYAAALDAIAAAESSVVLETYIFDTDEAGDPILQALAAASERGVRCSLLFDAIGSPRIAGPGLAAARRAGVDVHAFDMRSALRGRFQVNLRNHRKILVVDGHVGFTGGCNFSARHLTSAPLDERSEDVHFLVRGPAVAQLSAVFAEDWYSTTGKTLAEALYFPAIPSAGKDVCRVLPSGPDGDYGAFHEVLVAAIHGAQRSVSIVTPYFVPSDEVTLAMRVAARRGVFVSVTLPERLDHKYVLWASNSFLEPLLEAGVEILRRPGPFLHAKVLVVDGVWALVGSSNIDPRSFFLNYELNLGVVGPAVARIGAWVDEQRRISKRVKLEEFANRGVARRAWENFWGLFRPML